MADTTIDQLTQSTPGSAALLPYSQAGVTYSVAPSALLQNVGNVGIGTTTPSSKLSVKGTLSASGEINGLIVGRGGGSQSSNVAIGFLNLYGNTTGVYNVAIGHQALNDNTTGSNNTAIGNQSLQRNKTGNNNMCLGQQANFQCTSGNENTAIGFQAMYSNVTGYNNVGIGGMALFQNVTGAKNTAIGFQSLFNLGNNTITPDPKFNCSGLGYDSQVTAGNQVQLGDQFTSTFAYGAVQNRSDERDKADIRDTALGLQFIMALRPVDFKWDYREDYRTSAPVTVHKPAELQVDASDADRIKYEHDVAQHAAYVQQHDAWVQSTKLGNVTRDGSKKRTRYHHGLVAQEVQAVLQNAGIDFGGYQNHAIAGGDDVQSIGYAELIAPLIKAVQELAAKVAALESQ